MTAKKAKPKTLMAHHLEQTFGRAADKPLVEPALAVSMALSMMVPGPARLISPQGQLVRLILLGIRLAGYKIVPR